MVHRPRTKLGELFKSTENNFENNLLFCHQEENRAAIYCVTQKYLEQSSRTATAALVSKLASPNTTTVSTSGPSISKNATSQKTLWPNLDDQTV